MVQLKQTLDEINSIKSIDSIKGDFEKNYCSKTTHLIIDFKRTFEQQEININKKCLLIAAAVNKCRLVRFEWILHSRKKKQFIDVKKYLIENYINDLDEYEEEDFDIKLIRLIRHLKDKKHQLGQLSLFSHLKQIYLIKENTDLEKDDDDFDVMMKNKMNTIYDYFIDIMSKFGANLTSRAGMAELIIAIDKTDDLDLNNKEHRLVVEKERDYFVKCVNEIQNLTRKKSSVQILSSSWIIGND